VASLIWLKDIAILPRGCPNKLSKFFGEIPHSGTALPKRKLDASRIVGYGVAAQKPPGRVNFLPVLLKLALMGIAQV
jgi:hypothetical protein